MNKGIKETKDIFIKKCKETKKSSLVVYLILKILVIICMITQIVKGNWFQSFLCFFALLLFIIPTLINEKLKIKLPNLLETIIYLFIFSAEILGEINNLYGVIPYWDTILHTLNGFLAAGIGFSLIDILNKNSKHIQLSAEFVAIVAFCFSMTIGVTWEFVEYSADKFIKFDMQKDSIVTEISSIELNADRENVPVKINNIVYTEIYNYENDELKKTEIQGGYLDIGLNDTMEDLLVNFIGATIFSIFGYLYIKNRDKYKFASNFIPTKEW